MGIEFKGILPAKLIIKKVVNKVIIMNLTTLVLTIEFKLSIKDCFKIEYRVNSLNKLKNANENKRKEIIIPFNIINIYASS